jgi:2Fe-2S type ferredoxin
MSGVLAQARTMGGSGASAGLAQQRRRGAAVQQQQRAAAPRRRASLRVAASGGVDLAREKISLPQPGAVESKGLSYKITLVAADDTRSFDCPDNAYILNAAEAAGLDLPATCRSGICGACVARRTAGSIDQSDVADLSFTLTDDEVEAGMTLLCMARATSDCTFETQSDWGYSLGITDWKGATGAFESRPDPLMGKSWAEGEGPK